MFQIKELFIALYFSDVSHIKNSFVVKSANICAFMMKE